MKKGILMLLCMVALFVVGCGEDKNEVQWRTCPSTHSLVKPANICLKKVGEGPTSEIRRADGGFIVLETPIPLEDKETRDFIDRTVTRGIADMIRNVKHHNPTWTKFDTTGPYQVSFVKRMADSIPDGFPALLIGPQEIKSAGTVINVGHWSHTNIGIPIMILPEPEDWNKEGYDNWLYWSAYNEGEHYFEHSNNIEVFFQFIGAGDIHPHWPIVTQSLTYVAPVDACQGLTESHEDTPVEFRK